MAAALLMGMAVQAAPGDVFLLQIPSINGGVNLSKYRGWILVNAFSSGVSTTTSPATGGGDSVSSSRTETLTIAAEQIQISSTPQRSDGGSDETSITDIDCQSLKAA